jgi:hypothetical protein
LAAAAKLCRRASKLTEPKISEPPPRMRVIWPPAAGTRFSIVRVLSWVTKAMLELSSHPTQTPLPS